MTIQPLRIRDLFALLLLGVGIAALVAAAEGRHDMTALLVLVAALLERMLSPRLEAGARWSRFDRVLLDICRQVPFGLVPTFALYLRFRAGADAGGPGWGVLPAAVLAALPCALGCVRFTRDDIQAPVLSGVRFGPSQAMLALAMVGLLQSHLFAGPPFVDVRSVAAPLLFAAGALALLWLALWNLSLSPGPAGPGAPHGRRAAAAFSGLLLVAAALAVLTRDPAAAADVLAAGLILALPLRGLWLPAETRRAASEAIVRFRQEWQARQGPGRS